MTATAKAINDTVKERGTAKESNRSLLLEYTEK
jgi:hypothetical protein